MHARIGLIGHTQFSALCEELGLSEKEAVMVSGVRISPTFTVVVGTRGLKAVFDCLPEKRKE